jgi:chorismate synthase
MLKRKPQDLQVPVPTFPLSSPISESLCRAAFDRNAKGRSRSSRSSEEHDGLEISSLIGDDKEGNRSPISTRKASRLNVRISKKRKSVGKPVGLNRTLSLEALRVEMGERFPSSAVFASSLCRAAFDRNAKGRSRSSRSSEEHDGLEISSLIGDDNGKVGVPVPTFPLSSPISEEISSPSCSSEDLEERDRPFAYVSVDLTVSRGLVAEMTFECLHTTGKH